jgi:hypothetical protein
MVRDRYLHAFTDDLQDNKYGTRCSGEVASSRLAAACNTSNASDGLV